MDNKEIGKRIREIRKQCKMNQDDFAEMLSTSRDKLASYELGRLVNLDRVFLEYICLKQNVNIEWLLSGKGNMYNEIVAEDIYFRAVSEIDNNNDIFAREMIIEYWKMDELSKKAFKKALLNIAGRVKEEGDI